MFLIGCTPHPNKHCRECGGHKPLVAPWTVPRPDHDTHRRRPGQVKLGRLDLAMGPLDGECQEDRSFSRRKEARG